MKILKKERPIIRSASPDDRTHLEATVVLAPSFREPPAGNGFEWTEIDKRRAKIAISGKDQFGVIKALETLDGSIVGIHDIRIMSPNHVDQETADRLDGERAAPKTTAGNNYTPASTLPLQDPIPKPRRSPRSLK